MHQPPDEHPGSDGVGDPVGEKGGGKVAHGQFDPIDGDAGLDGELRRQFNAGTAVADGGDGATKEAALLDGHGPGDAPLVAHGVCGVDILEGVAADGNGHVGRDPERSGQHFIAACGIEPQLVTVLEVDLKTSLGDPGLDVAGPVLDVVEARADKELSDGRQRYRPGTVLAGGERAPEIIASEVADFRIEIIAHAEMVDLRGVEVTVVGEDALVAGIIAVQTRGLAFGVEAIDVDVVVKGEVAIDPIDLVGPAAGAGDGAAGEDGADGAAAKDVAFDAQDGKVGQERLGGLLGVRVTEGHTFDVEGAEGVVTHSATKPATSEDGNGLALFQPDAPTEEDCRGIAAAAEPTGPTAGPWSSPS